MSYLLYGDAKKFLGKPIGAVKSHTRSKITHFLEKPSATSDIPAKTQLNALATGIKTEYFTTNTS